MSSEMEKLISSKCLGLKSSVSLRNSMSDTYPGGALISLPLLALVLLSIAFPFCFIDIINDLLVNESRFELLNVNREIGDWAKLYIIGFVAKFNGNTNTAVHEYAAPSSFNIQL